MKRHNVLASVLFALAAVACTPIATPLSIPHTPDAKAKATEIAVTIYATQTASVLDSSPTAPATDPLTATSLSTIPQPWNLIQRTKTTGCVASNGLPDPACTPGAIFPDATTSQICTPGYSASVRNVPDSVKNQAFAEYGITSHAPGQYEVDHLISLELGGSNDIANLFPQAAEPRPGFHEKDQVENWLHDQVCRGAMALSNAQIGIAQNWVQFYGLAASPGAGSPSKLAPVATPTAPALGNCDPSYPDVCIPPPPPDLNCNDIPYRRFRVLPPDPHRFDGDHDGIGCES